MAALSVVMCAPPTAVKMERQDLTSSVAVYVKKTVQRLFVMIVQRVKLPSNGLVAVAQAVSQGVEPMRIVPTIRSVPTASAWLTAAWWIVRVAPTVTSQIRILRLVVIVRQRVAQALHFPVTKASAAKTGFALKWILVAISLAKAALQVLSLSMLVAVAPTVSPYHVAVLILRHPYALRG